MWNGWDPIFGKRVEVTEIGANPYKDESFKSNETTVLDSRN